MYLLKQTLLSDDKIHEVLNVLNKVSLFSPEIHLSNVNMTLCLGYNVCRAQGLLIFHRFISLCNFMLCKERCFNK